MLVQFFKRHSKVTFLGVIEVLLFLMSSIIFVAGKEFHWKKMKGDLGILRDTSGNIMWIFLIVQIITTILQKIMQSILTR